jgi:LmeA-like phospholipid-binding
LSAPSPGIIGSILSPACAAWLRTKVSSVGSLQIKIAAKDRQIISGVVPSVSVIAHETVYRGISLQRIQLLAQQIEVNLGQVVRGQQLRLLQPILVEANATIGEADLLSSLTAPLLADPIADLIAKITGAGDTALSVSWQAVQLQADLLTLIGQLTPQGTPITIHTGIQVIDGHILDLQPLKIDCTALGNQLPEYYQIDLGPEVDLTELTIQAGSLTCQGQIQVRP